MKTITIDKNRRLDKASIVIGFIEENKAETLHFDIPEEYQDYIKKANFSTSNGCFSILLDENNSINFTNSITNCYTVDMALEFVKDDIVARTTEITIYFEKTIVGEDIDPEEPKVLLLNDLIKQVDTMDIDATEDTIIITRKDGETKEVQVSGGTGGGTTNYEKLSNKPFINNIELVGNKTLEELGIQPTGDYALKSELPTKVSELENDLSFIKEDTYKEELSDYVKWEEMEDEVVVIPYEKNYDETEKEAYGELIESCFNASYDILKPLFVSYSGTLIPYIYRINTTALVFGCSITDFNDTIHYVELQVNINTDETKLESIEKTIDEELVVVDELDEIKTYVDEKIASAIGTALEGSY